MNKLDNSYGVILLNWNGAQDTIECVESILNNNQYAFIIIVDNDSKDDSIANIINWSERSSIKLLAIDADKNLLDMLDVINLYNILLYKSNKNLGFSKGCNLGLHLATILNIKSIVMLNNDTVVNKDALKGLITYLDNNINIFAVIPKINYYHSNKIWNCGGTISRFGFRKYNYSDVDETQVVIPKVIECSFFTGCCFAVRTDEFNARDGFTEKFFFGEEDFELSLWMKDNKKKAVCLTEYSIEHKVSASIKKASSQHSPSKVFIHYLNRFIHMRLRFGTTIWILWLFLYVPYIMILLTKNKILSFFECKAFIVSLLRMSKEKNSVTHDDFQSIMRSRPW